MKSAYIAALLLMTTTAPAWAGPLQASQPDKAVLLATPRPVVIPAEGSLRLGAGASAGDVTNAPAEAMTLAAAFVSAWAYHPQIEGDRSLTRAAKANARSLESALLPTVRADVEANLDTFTQGAGISRFNGRIASLEATQLLFDGFQAGNRVHAARAEQLATEWEFRANTIALANNVARAYMSVMRERDMLGAALRNLDEHRRAVGRITQVVKSDPGKRFDLSQIRSREAFAASLVTEREGALNQAIATYRETIGRVPGPLTKPTNLPNGNGFRSLDDALAVGTRVHPLIQVATNRYVRRTHERQAAEGLLIPRVDLTGRLLKGSDRAGLLGQNDEAYVGVRGSYSFPLGGGAILQANNAGEIERNAAFQVDLARRNMRESVRVAWAQRQAIIDTIKHVRNHYEISSSVLEGYRTQYTLGRRTILDLLIIQNETYQAEARLMSLEADKVAADFNLAAQIGIIDRFVPLPDVAPLVAQ